MKKILIVEDDQLVASAYKKRFQEAGYAVEWAPDGLEGIKMVAALKPDVVLLDLLMPRLDGIEVLKYIRSHGELKNLPVVVFSNSYMTNLVENAWRAGADQCLMKASTTPAQLFDVVNKAIQKASTRAVDGHANVPQPRTTPAAATPLLPPMTMPSSAPARPSSPMPAGGAAVVPLVTPLARPSVASTPAPSPAVSPSKNVPAPAAADPEFQEQIRQLFLSSAPAKLASMRDAANAFIQDQGSSMQLPLLADLFRRVHSLTGNAAVAGCSVIAHYASTFEALLQELQTKPKFISISSTRTIAQAVEFMEMLFKHAGQSAPPPAGPVQVAVVDADAVSSQAIALALETAGYQALLCADPAYALVQLPVQPCAAVIVSVALPGMSGFELCAQLQALPGYARMPLLFVTTQNDFLAHSIPEVLGENDLIAQPYLLIELTLKAVTHVEWGRLVRGGSRE